MTDPIFWRLVWKEYRVQRGFWISLFAFAFLAQGMVLYFVDRFTEAFDGSLLVALLVPAVYALGSGAIGYASEHEGGTFERLKVLAAPPIRLFASKLGLGMAGTLLLFGCLCLLPLAVIIVESSPGRFTPTGLSNLAKWTGVWLFVMLIAMLWGVFFSLLTRNVLGAICLAAAMTVLSPIGVVPAIVTVAALRMFVTAESFFTVSAIMLSFFALLLLVVDYWLARRWILGKEGNRFAGRLRARAERSRTRPRTVLLDVDQTAPAARRQLRRLVWQEWRHARGIAFAFVGLGQALWMFNAISSAGSRLPGDGYAEIGLYLPILIAPVLLGVWSFRAEQRGESFRFLSERGVTARTIWLSKHLIWLSTAMLVTATCVLTNLMALWLTLHNAFVGSGLTFLGQSNRVIAWMLPFLAVGDQPSAGQLVCHLLLIVGLAYWAGQWASMFLSRAVTAVFVALVLFGLLMGWYRLVCWLQVPLIFSAAPIPLILMASTFFHTPAWLLQRNTPRTWLRVGLTLLVPGVLVVAAVAAYRVYEIPVESLRQVPTELLRPSTALETETAAMYQRATAALSPIPPRPRSKDPYYRPSKELSIVKGWQDADAAHAKWLGDNEEALELALKASKRQSCAFIDPSHSMMADMESLSKLREMYDLSSLILVSARELEARGELDQAFQRYLAVLRMGRHVTQRGGDLQFSVGDRIRSRAFLWMRRWAGHPAQTRARLMDAVQTINEQPSGYSALREAYIQTFLQRRRSLAEEPQAVARALRESDDSVSTAVAVLDRLCPWERFRAIRVCDRLAHEAATLLSSFDQNLSTGQTGMSLWVLQHADHPLNQFDSVAWIHMTPLVSIWFPAWRFELIERAVNTETRRRAMLITLALCAWRSDHGELPARLDQLQGAYFERLPIDPWSGRSFEYRPSGFPSSVQFPRGTVEANRPLLWSVGLHDVRVVEQKPIPARMAQPIARMAQPLPSKSGEDEESAASYTIRRSITWNRRRGNGSLNSGDGIAFPIP